MATTIQPLTIEEFRERFHDQKPYFEYWFGEAIQKTVPTWLHSVVQQIMLHLLRNAGYKTGPEVELRIDPEWQPVPDVIGTRESIRTPYPTTPVEIVVEILSPDDRMSHVMKKCYHYARIGIPQVFVLDPEEKVGWEWKSGSLDAVKELSLAKGAIVSLDEVWRQLAEQS